MTTGEYILALLAIISGLAITHLIGATSSLIEHRRRVRWDWLPIVAAAYLGYLVIYSWWLSFAAFHAETAQLPFYRFLMPTLSVTFLALAVRAALPDKVAEDGFDLAEHYRRNCRFIFSCLLGCQAMAAWGTAIRWRTGNDLTSVLPGGAAVWFGATALIVLLALIRRRIIHAFVVPALLVALIATSITRVV